jgi:elongator complex protein 6
MDLERLSAMKRFTFIDGLSGLYLPHLGPPTSTSEAHNTLRSADLASIQSQIQEALRTSKANNDNGKVILVIDQLDLLLATSCDKISAVAISNMLLELRQVGARIFML